MKNRISSQAFDLPCPACILERPILLRDELRPSGRRPSQLDGTWAVCRRGYHAVDAEAEDVLREIRG